MLKAQFNILYMQRKLFLVLMLILFPGLVVNLFCSTSDLKQLEKETIYVLAPARWSNADIRQTFGSNFQKLDTSSKMVNPTIHRIGLTGAYISWISFISKYYPNVQQLLIDSIIDIPPGVESLSQLRSLKIGVDIWNSPISPYVNNTFSGDDQIHYSYIDYRAPDFIRKYPPTLKEVMLLNSIPYVPESIYNQNSLRRLHVAVPILPLFVLQKNCPIILTGFMDGNYAYPELAALAASGYANNYPIPVDDGAIFFPTNSTKHDSTDALPYWYPGCNTLKRPKPKALPKNGSYSLFYPNGKTIVSGNMIKGKPDGEWHFWFADGTISETRHYINGIEDGAWICYSEDGDTSRTFTFDKGNLLRVSVFYYEKRRFSNVNYVAETARCRQFNLSSFTSTEVASLFYQNNAQDTCTYYLQSTWNPDSSVINVFSVYSKNKQLRRTVTYSKSGISNTLDIPLEYEFPPVYYRTYAPSQDSVFDTTWYYNSGICTAIKVIKGDCNFSKWNTSGQLIETGVFTGNDTLDGTRIFYSSDGKISRTSEYKNGILDGITRIFNINGELIDERNYSKGTVVNPK